ncbi:MAG: hypothetical protein JW965_04110 [Bacteroidales bacterium]|nr:hypothetical protein [Bacteroidales bacterium]
MDESTKWWCLARLISGFAVVIQVETCTTCVYAVPMEEKIRSYLQLTAYTK